MMWMKMIVVATGMILCGGEIACGGVAGSRGAIVTGSGSEPPPSLSTSDTAAAEEKPIMTIGYAPTSISSNPLLRGRYPAPKPHGSFNPGGVITAIVTGLLIVLILLIVGALAAF